MQSKNNVEALKLQYEATISEYQALRQNVIHHSEIQGQSDNIALVALGGSIPLILAILNQSTVSSSPILLLPMLFLVIVFTQLRQERLLLVSAMYIDAHLRPRCEKILSLLSLKDAAVFQWEEYLARRTWAPNLALEWLAVCTRGAIGFTAGLSITGVYIFARSTGQPVRLAPNPYDAWLLAVNALLFLVDLAIAFRVATTRYNYLKEYYRK